MRALATPRSTHSRSRRLGAVASLVLVSVLAAGCGDDSGGGNDSEDGSADSGEIAALTDEQVDAAVLQPENFSEGWTSSDSTDDEEGEAPGCFAEIDALTEELTKEGERETTFEFGDSGVPSVQSRVSTYPDAEAVAATFDEVQEALTSCTAITGTDGDGVTWDVALTTDEEVTVDGFDDQLNISGSGTITSPDGQELELHIYSTQARLGANVTTVATTDLDDSAADHQVWAQMALERVLAVANGDEPAATTAPDPA